MDAGAWALLGTLALAAAGSFGVVYNGRQRAREREQDRQERQHVADEVSAAAVLTQQVAKEAKEAADRLLDDQAIKQAAAIERAALLAEQNELVERRARETANSLRVIHGLVDGNLTRAQQRALVAMKEMLAAKKEVVDLKSELGMPPTETDLAAIEEAQKRITAMSQDLVYKVDMTRPATDKEAH